MLCPAPLTNEVSFEMFILSNENPKNNINFGDTNRRIFVFKRKLLEEISQPSPPLLDQFYQSSVFHVSVFLGINLHDNIKKHNQENGVNGRFPKHISWQIWVGKIEVSVAKSTEPRVLLILEIVPIG